MNRKMIRKIIIIDKEKCNGCGACVDACHEGAIGLREGKATLLRDDYCDGLGDCLPACPTDAISFEEREALPYDEAAVLANMKKRGKGCPGAQEKVLTPLAPPSFSASAPDSSSRLRQWPVQIRLVPADASYFQNADILIAADCAAFAHGAFHTDFMEGKVTLIGCPKLDSVDYTDKLTDILSRNSITSVTVARMSVPCCGGLEHAVRAAVTAGGKNIPVSVAVIAPDGSVRQM